MESRLSAKSSSEPMTNKFNNESNVNSVTPRVQVMKMAEVRNGNNRSTELLASTPMEDTQRSPNYKKVLQRGR